MIFRFFMSLIAIFFPWLILLLEDNPGGAVVALIMQASIIGWPFAAVWAIRTQRESWKLQAQGKIKAREDAAEEKRKAKEESKQNIEQ